MSGLDPRHYGDGVLRDQDDIVLASGVATGHAHRQTEYPPPAYERGRDAARFMGDLMVKLVGALVVIGIAAGIVAAIAGVQG